ncbi:hypothetical protein WJX73_008496 [Symbiochloris irregularis]|uniref:Uncharacterized protein n=1 Tax=Symbiochloris irregularis TaxID=706552 RepID=A0AAW1NVX9_9CHLO
MSTTQETAGAAVLRSVAAANAAAPSAKTSDRRPFSDQPSFSQGPTLQPAQQPAQHHGNRQYRGLSGQPSDISLPAGGPTNASHDAQGSGGITSSDGPLSFSQAPTPAQRTEAPRGADVSMPGDLTVGHSAEAVHQMHQHRHGDAVAQGTAESEGGSDSFESLLDEDWRPSAEDFDADSALEDGSVGLPMTVGTAPWELDTPASSGLLGALIDAGPNWAPTQTSRQGLPLPSGDLDPQCKQGDGERASASVTQTCDPPSQVTEGSWILRGRREGASALDPHCNQGDAEQASVSVTQTCDPPSQVTEGSWILRGRREGASTKE